MEPESEGRTEINIKKVLDWIEDHKLYMNISIVDGENYIAYSELKYFLEEYREEE